MNKQNKILCSNSFCSSLENTTREYLCKKGIKIKLNAREEIMFDFSNRQVMLIDKGQLFSLRIRKNGKSKAIERLKEGDILGVTLMFGNHKTNISHIFTKTPVECCLFSIEQLEGMCCEFQDFACKMIETLSRRFSESISQIEHLTLDTSKEKVLYVLESLGPDFFNINRLAYTHEELAQFAGINRVTVTRALEHIKSLPKK